MCVLLLHRMDGPSKLLALPDPCLLAVLQGLASEDQRSLFCAARAHSRLHQAAVVALHSIKVHVGEQQQMDSVLLYLDKYGQHVDSIHLVGMEWGAVTLCQLPSHLQLSSLQLELLHLQLQPGNGSHGVLGAAAVAALKQLRLSHCELLDGEEQLAAALLQLPAWLEHLSIVGVTADEVWVGFPTNALQRLQQLTYLELAEVTLQGCGQGQPARQPLQALTHLQDLRLCTGNGAITTSVLSGTHHLTRLELSGEHTDDGVYLFEPGVLAGKTQLRHLQLAYCRVLGDQAGVARLMSHLWGLPQLTHLNVWHSVLAFAEGNPSAATFSALRAISKLQHLGLCGCTLPVGVWQHVFPAGRQLPHLKHLNISTVTHPGAHFAAPPEGRQLVSCCPSLQSLDIQWLPHEADLLPALQGLSGLHTLRLNADGVHGVCRLTGLRALSVHFPYFNRTGSELFGKELLLELTQLRQLTALTYIGAFCGRRRTICLTAAVSWAVMSRFPWVLAVSG